MAATVPVSFSSWVVLRRKVCLAAERSLPSVESVGPAPAAHRYRPEFLLLSDRPPDTLPSRLRCSSSDCPATAPVARPQSGPTVKGRHQSTFEKSLLPL